MQAQALGWLEGRGAGMRLGRLVWSHHQPDGALQHRSRASLRCVLSGGLLEALTSTLDGAGSPSDCIFRYIQLIGLGLCVTKRMRTKMCTRSAVGIGLAGRGVYIYIYNTK